MVLGMGFVELVIAIVIAVFIFILFWKVFKVALETAFVILLVIVGFYIALHILDAPIASSFVRFLNEVKSALGF